MNRQRARLKRSYDHGLRKMCPCSQRNWKTCPHSWMLFKKPRGQKQIRVSLRTASHAEAVDEADRYLRGHATPATRPATFGQLADLYIAARADKEHDYKLAAARKVVLANGRTLDEMPIADVATADIEHIQRHWLARDPRGKGGRVGANRVMARLRHVFNWAIDQDYASRTPFRRNGRPTIKLDRRAETGRDRRLVGDEERRLFAAFDPAAIKPRFKAQRAKLDPAAPRHKRKLVAVDHAEQAAMANASLLEDLVTAAMNTGCRKDELMSLQWQDVRDAAIALPAEKTKTRRARSIPINAALREVLVRRRLGPDGQRLGPGCHVFGTDTGDERAFPQDAWTTLRDAAGLVDFHFHDLRHEFGSRLLETGATLHEVRDALGHANLTMTSVYLNSTAERQQQAVDRLPAPRRKAAAVVSIARKRV